MTRESVSVQDWTRIVEALGGSEALDASARETKAFQRPHGIRTATDMLRLVLSYCLSEGGLRSTAARAAATGLADISNVALLLRLRQCGDWFALLISRLLASKLPTVGHGRLIRIIDATTVPKASKEAKKQSELWRIHSAFDLPDERFSHFELTDEKGGERFDRIPVIKGEFRIGDAAHMQPDRIAAVIEQGGDILVRANWKSAPCLDDNGEKISLVHEFRNANKHGQELIDRPVWLKRNNGPALALRLVAVKKPPEAAAEARRKLRRNGQREGYQPSQEALEAADWVILVTSVSPDEFSTADILALYRLRWRIELGFKRLKSLIGLKGPPGTDERSAKPYVLAHLLLILLLEPLVDEFEDSPHWLAVA